MKPVVCDTFQSFFNKNILLERGTKQRRILTELLSIDSHYESILHVVCHVFPSSRILIHVISWSHFGSGLPQSGMWTFWEVLLQSGRGSIKWYNGDSYDEVILFLLGFEHYTTIDIKSIFVEKKVAQQAWTRFLRIKTQAHKNDNN